ncbi:M15 family metallopeptidase [Microbacterium yannicii]|uniref:M15 family metallopeptidase n=1 Tax=Microbacterium yannicii TaxID=671622 RepID=UPI0018877EA9|nr:M15 family metallopeptidase [Microbacterium yannicii]MCO5952004.1 M15 family metallopeptidase [Microbacterium yannicii]
MTRTASARLKLTVALWGVILALVVVCAVSVGAALHQSAAAADRSGPGSPPPRPGTAAPAQGDAEASADGVVTEEDGILPAGVSVFDDAYPGVARLSPELGDALRRAADDAAQQGVVIHVNSGWRSPEYQDQLLQDAVSDYGSEAEAARWVATAATSAHVAGEAVDIGSFDAVAWMSTHGAAYGLCQTYSNESWHFELRPDAVRGGCPTPYADPTQDPRMQG